MDCLIDHYNRSCDLYGVGACESGNLTFTEDGPDLEGLRINYEWLKKNYNSDELSQILCESDSLSVNKEQSFFYLYGMSWCDHIRELKEHTDVHSPPQLRVNGVVTQMPEFSNAF
ncbi:hypothetical protein PMAYCL1PPCAC_01241, partial [Pristionchus mayeri]